MFLPFLQYLLDLIEQFDSSLQLLPLDLDPLGFFSLRLLQHALSPFEVKNGGTTPDANPQEPFLLQKRSGIRGD
jgi:hypothetical protein